MKKEITVIVKPKESFFQSAIKDSYTFGLMMLCIYVSAGSAWWTLFTGILFISFLFIKVSAIFKDKVGQCENIDEAIRFLESKR